jgi:hypothetical protein
LLIDFQTTIEIAGPVPKLLGIFVNPPTVRERRPVHGFVHGPLIATSAAAIASVAHSGT